MSYVIILHPAVLIYYFHIFITSSVSCAFNNIKPAARLAQSVERLTADREVAGLILGAGPICSVLK